MTDAVFFPVLLAVVIGVIAGTVVGMLVVLLAAPFHIPHVVKVTASEIGQQMVDDWLDRRGLIACPKGPDFRPARKPPSSAHGIRR